TTISAIKSDTEILIISLFLLALDLGTFGNLEKLTINSIVVIVKKDEVIIKDADGNVVERDSYIAEIDASDAEKGVYAHYM
ncbi:hypothetical protein IDG69_15645, partial [Staphylococcus sp. EG-SA-23]|nr:hypothetical protein [Staphylococcus sp. EG-SA-23]